MTIRALAQGWLAECDTCFWLSYQPTEARARRRAEAHTCPERRPS